MASPAGTGIHATLNEQVAGHPCSIHCTGPEKRLALHVTSPCPATPSPASRLLGGSRSTSYKYLPESSAGHRPAQLVIGTA
jgi:hypothetical protein